MFNRVHYGFNRNARFNRLIFKVATKASTITVYIRTVLNIKVDVSR